MNSTQRTSIMHTRWHIVQEELLLELQTEIGALTPKLAKLVHILEWARIEEFVKTIQGTQPSSENQ